MGTLAMQFGQADFVFAHLVGYAEGLDKATLYRELLTQPPAEKIRRMRRLVNGREDQQARLFSVICDRFEEILEDRNRLIHAYWYRFPDDPNKFMFVDIHGKKDNLSKETHTCSLEEVENAGIHCGVFLHNLGILLPATEHTAGFFDDYYQAPDALGIGNPAPRKRRLGAPTER